MNGSTVVALVLGVAALVVAGNVISNYTFTNQTNGKTYFGPSAPIIGPGATGACLPDGSGC